MSKEEGRALSVLAIWTTRYPFMVKGRVKGTIAAESTNRE